MKTHLLSSLAKVFKDREPNFHEFCEHSCLKNEKFSFQTAVFPETECETEVRIDVDSSLKADIRIYFVRNIPAGRNKFDYSDAFRYDPERTEFPDLLQPVSGSVTLEKGNWYSFWIEYKPHSDISGKYPITVIISTSDGETRRTFTLDIIDCALPEQELLYTNWFHNDCLLTYYKFEIFSKEYWQTVENYIKNAAEYGMNMILTPIFTPPLDTQKGGERPTVQLVKVKKEGNKYSFDFENFEKYVALCLKHNIKAFEISHFFTQWGAENAPKIVAEIDGKETRIFGWETDASGDEYREFLTCFAKAFKTETQKLGITDKCMLHVSDEPSEEMYENYKSAAEFLYSLFSEYKFFDALSDIEYYRSGIVKTPVCAEDKADIFKPETKEFWTYHCCCQDDNCMPNRFFAHPSVRNRILGVLLYKYEARGFLQWGHNFWYSQYSLYAIDPYKVTDAGGSFPSGDSFSVYPGADKKPLNSLRNIVFAEALQDLRAFKLLEKLTSRTAVLKIIENGLDIPLSFKNYPHEQSYILQLRRNVNTAIKNANDNL